MYPYNHKKGQRIQTDVEGVSCDRAFPAYFEVDAASAVAASNVGILAATALAAAPASVVAGLTNPAVPRVPVAKGNAAGIVGNVVIHGTNIADEVISETLALNGANVVTGTKAFKTVTKVDLPAETHAGTDTVSIGWCDKLGLPYLLERNSVLVAYENGVREAALPTVTFSKTAFELNTVLLGTALGGKVVGVYLLV